MGGIIIYNTRLTNIYAPFCITNLDAHQQANKYVYHSYTGYTYNKTNLINV